MFGERGTDIGDRASRVGAVDVEKMRERQTDNDVDELPARSARGMRGPPNANGERILDLRCGSTYRHFGLLHREQPTKVT